MDFDKIIDNYVESTIKISNDSAEDEVDIIENFLIFIEIKINIGNILIFFVPTVINVIGVSVEDYTGFSGDAKKVSVHYDDINNKIYV